MKSIGNKQFCNDFMRGQIDCRNGAPHKAKDTPAYDRGYACQYEREQVITNRSQGNESKRLS